MGILLFRGEDTEPLHGTAADGLEETLRVAADGRLDQLVGGFVVAELGGAGHDVLCEQPLGAAFTAVQDPGEEG